MDKLKFETPDMVAGNIEKIGALFPSAITEMRGEDGQIKKGINFEVLKQLLSRDVVDGDECYEFTWVGKKAAMAEAARPTTKTLRPVKEDSRDWDTTQNLYIEGDNLEVLKILQESYLGKVKMIYIDPPYNTGHDLIYLDNFQKSQLEESERIGLYDEDDYQLFENAESNGRFHSDWCSSVYGALSLARNLLSECGIILISIDDKEVHNLRKICDDIFGASNFMACIVWQKKTSPDARMDISAAHDYVLIYAKHKPEKGFLLNSLPYDENRLSSYKNLDGDPRGPWASVDITGQTGRAPKSQFYEIETPSGKKYFPPEGRCWAMAQSTYEELFKDHRLWFGENGDNRPRLKKFLFESEGQRPWTWWDNKFASYNQASNKELMQLFDGKLVFDNPKPIQFISRILELTTQKQQNDIVLDFYSGSCTTAEAVMRANYNDGGNRKFICVQIPQPISDSGNEHKANNIALSMGFKTICEIGKERIRRAGDKIQRERLEAIGLTKHEWDQTCYYAEHQEECDKLGHLPDSYFEKEFPEIDTGFRVFRVDSSNMKDVFYQPEELEQVALGEMVSNIKDDRTDMDLLYACLLDWGVEIHLPHTSTDHDGCTIHNVDNGALMACFNPNVPTSVVEFMAKQQPLRAVFRDSAFASDDAKINVTEIFKNLSPDTKVKVI